MQALDRGIEQLFVPRKQQQHRSKSGRADRALDSARARAEKDCALRCARAYPSPPMSGTPPRPPKPSQEVAERGQGGFQATTHDAFRAVPAISGQEYRIPPRQPSLPPPLPTGRPLALESPERVPYQYRRPEDMMGRSVAYPAPPGHIIPQSQYPLPPVAVPGPGQVRYSVSVNPTGPENAPFPSPKSQRKTKGHVASACVPCKRAHLRCDAQRPCSRCLSNGKEDACVDVQHKKRGRPRLRDDRETRFDTSRFAHAPDTALRRPLSSYNPANAPPVSFDDPLRRSQSYRVLKSHPSEPAGPRFIERGTASDANVFSAPLSLTPQATEPLAFLMIGDLKIVKASNTFVDAITSNTQAVPRGYGSQAVVGRKLIDMITPPERDRVAALCKALQTERLTKEPNSLPPIYGRDEEERVILSQPLGPGSLSRYQLDRQDFFTFVTADGQPRPHAVRVGLAKDDSIYFVVLLLASSGRHPYPPSFPPPRSRDTTYPYQHQQPFAQLMPPSVPFDPARPRLVEPAPRESSNLPSRRPETPTQHGVQALGPGMRPNVPAYAASALARSQHPGGLAHQPPRSELHPPSGTSQQTVYQLPPIRTQQPPGPPTEATWQRDSRATRVDIGGLLEKPETPPRRDQ
ncbi:hypothetical protein F5Y17DRAFT_167658 [Xylariaceae sp. FL0594]|nr:hypothetical protein F5Y17DRAFT_167658 [Xylariaceae sp. FL0594]